MGTWGIARDMAKLNEENLSRLSSSRGVYKEYIKHGSIGKKVYKYNESTPEMLAAIRSFKLVENRRILRRQIILGVICAGLFVASMWLIFSY